jgi:hypothetical protein
MLAKKPKGWWRRNVWGLVLILPLLAGTVFVRWSEFYEDIWKAQPLHPLSAAQEQWVEFNTAQLRLVEFGQAANLVDRSNKPLALPGGLKAWRAVVEFKAPDQDAMNGCKVTLEDAAGREFGLNPVELSTARVTPKSSSCTKPDEKGPNDYRATFYFVMPGDAQPVAVRVMWSTRYPEFARLAVA